MRPFPAAGLRPLRCGLRGVALNLSRLFDVDFADIPIHAVISSGGNGDGGAVNGQNSTAVMGLEEDAVDQANRLVQVYVLFALAGLGFVGNIVVIVILCTKRSRERCFTNINFLILQLAVSDLMVVAFCLFADAIWKATYRYP